jgi:hypothetical protein
MRNLDLKGCNEIQALGGIETYQRRYLYMLAFDFVESDLFDSIAGSDKNISNNKATVESVQKAFPNSIEVITDFETLKQKLLDSLTLEQLYSYKINHQIKELTEEQKKELTNVYENMKLKIQGKL